MDAPGSSETGAAIIGKAGTVIQCFLLSKVVQRLLACAVAAGVLWSVVVHSGPRESVES
jgi:hypothetical protein